MNKLLFAKSLIGTSIFIGTSTAGSYFGTKTTIEQHLSDRGQTRPLTPEKWEANYWKLRNDRNLPWKKKTKTEKFKSLKKWTDLKNECDKELNKTYRVFWKKWEIEENSKQDLKAYCLVN